MVCKIQRLSEETINQIAAGEVVENPASVAKELVENAIDAGAMRVRVEAEQGGFARLCVIDDGCGMQREDLLLCCERHATSKIASGPDLALLTTLGFRGEALSSIAGIAHVGITSATEEGVGAHVIIAAGRVLEEGISARQRGTTVEVRELFFNVPARKKFQKSAQASAADLTRIVTKLALAHPRVGFVLEHNGRQVLHVPGTALPGFEAIEPRVSALLGQEFLDACVPCTSLPWLFGLIEDPITSTRVRSGAYLFVNARPIESPFLLDVIRGAYGTRMDRVRKPRLVLHLQLAPEMIDVNVHPQKSEVRFRDESALQRDVENAIHSALNRQVTPTSWEIRSNAAAEHIPVKTQNQALSFHGYTSGPFVAEEAEDVYPRKLKTWELDKEAPRFFCPVRGTVFKDTARVQDEKSVGKPTQSKTKFSVSSGIQWVSPEIAGEKRIHALGILGHRLLLDAQEIGSPPGLAIVDLRAADAALKAHALMDQRACAVQGLLIPRPMTFAPHEAERMASMLDLFEELGFIVRPFGHQTFALEGVPSILSEEEAEEVVREAVAADLRTRERLVRSLSKGSIRRGKHFTQQQGERLVEELLRRENPFVSPFGERIVRLIEEDDLV